MRPPLGLLLFLPALCSSCHQPPSATRPTARIIATTEPSAPNAVERLSSLEPGLHEIWRAYVATEGDAHRGDQFARVAWALDFMRFRNPPVPVSDLEVLSFLGLPDCGKTRDKNAAYVYSYWRTETNSRWVAIVFIESGQLKSIGWNDASVNDFSTCKHYRKWSDVLGLTR
jgi:hypothetical protein